MALLGYFSTGLGKRESNKKASKGGTSKVDGTDVLPELNRTRIEAGLGIAPKGTGGSIASHVGGLDSKYVSASLSEDAIAKYGSGNGLIRIDVKKAIAEGFGYVDHGNVMQAVKREGVHQSIKDAAEALEVLFKNGIPRSAIELIN